MYRFLQAAAKVCKIFHNPKLRPQIIRKTSDMAVKIDEYRYICVKLVDL